MKSQIIMKLLVYGLTDKNSYAFALHDCDIVNYSREIPARLFFPIVHSALDFEFNKGFYSRVTYKLHGRATRLLYSPLIHGLEKVFGRSETSRDVIL